MIDEIMLQLTGENFFEDVGTEYRYLCPFCHHESHKFYISHQGKSKGMWICFNCSQHGSLVGLVHGLKGIPYSQAKQFLEYFGLDTVTIPVDDLNRPVSLIEALMRIRYNFGSQEVTKTKMHAYPTNTKSLTANYDNPEAFPFYEYLLGRGLTFDDVERYRLNYVIEGHFERKDHKPQLMTNSLVFTTFDRHNKPLYWSSRSIVPALVKSINSPNYDNEYGRKDIIWNLNTLQQGDTLVVFEGIFNAIMADNAQINGQHYCGVATLGKNVSQNQVQALLANQDKYKRLIIFLDNDALDSTLRLADNLTKHGLSASKLYLIDNPYGNKDANDLGRFMTQRLISESIRPYNFATRVNYMNRLRFL